MITYTDIRIDKHLISNSGQAMAFFFNGDVNFTHGSFEIPAIDGAERSFNFFEETNYGFEFLDDDGNDQLYL